MKYSISAIIFAGGKSSRMGQDKALLPFASYDTLSEFQYERLKSFFFKVYISSKSNKFNFDVEVIEDKHKVSSPLVGIISVLEILEAHEVFILSVDAPFVDKKIIEKLLAHKGDFDAIIPRSPNGIQPLCGVYKHSILPLAKKQLRENKHKINDLLDKAKTLFIDFDSDAPFVNLNHPHEYEKALKS